MKLPFFSKLNSLSDETKEQIYLSVTAIVALLRFVNLGFLDLQAWDEALYAVRAEGILRFGHWIDQSSFAIDGLYSALHPPLYVWLTAVSFEFFGITEFAARCFSAVAAGLTLPIIFHIGKRIANPQIGFLAALLFGLNPFVTFFARQGQFDSTLVFFLSLAMLWLIKAQDGSSLKYGFLAGLAVGAALMTKLYIGMGIPLAYITWILFAKPANKSPHWKIFAVMMLGTILVASPWHIYMTIAHGDGNPFFFITASALFERSLSGVEGNIKPLEVFYFFNQLFVLFPVGVCWFGYGIYKTLKNLEYNWLLLGIWFLVFFIVFSLMRTKLAVYLLPMLVPASLIGARELHNAVNAKFSPKTLAVLIGGTIISIVWATSQLWRNVIKAVLLNLVRLKIPTMAELIILTPLAIILALSLTVLYLTYKNNWLNTFARSLPVILLLPSFILCGYNVLVLDKAQYKDGTTELTAFIGENDVTRIVVAGYERNPQLTFYLEGIDIGWRDDIEMRRIIPPKDKAQFKQWLADELAGEPDETLVILEKDKFIRYELIKPEEIIPANYKLVFDSRRYTAFRRAKAVELAMLQNQTTESSIFKRTIRAESFVR